MKCGRGNRERGEEIQRKDNTAKRGRQSGQTNKRKKKGGRVPFIKSWKKKEGRGNFTCRGRRVSQGKGVSTETGSSKHQIRIMAIQKRGAAFETKRGGHLKGQTISHRIPPKKTLRQTAPDGGRGKKGAREVQIA